jgi:hypothetical protein
LLRLRTRLTAGDAFEPEQRQQKVKAEISTKCATVSAAEFGHDSRLVPITIDAPETLMDEALICLRERSGGKLVRAFLDMARSMSGD